MRAHSSLLWRHPRIILVAVVTLIVCGACGWPGPPPPIKAFLPYVEEVELPGEINAFEPFIVRLRISTPGKMSLLKNGLLSLKSVSSNKEGVLRLDAAVSLERGIPIPADRWCEVTMDRAILHFSENPSEATPILVEVLSADSPENGGLQGLLHWDGQCYFSHGYAYQEYPSTYIPYVPPQT
jgi:hypothetical protein